MGTKRVTYGKKLNLKIKPKTADIVPILLVNGQRVGPVKSGNGYKYALIPTGDTSVYATSEVEPVLAPATKVMDEETLKNLTLISDDCTVLTFTGITPYLESLQVDDVIVSTIITDTTPYGLFRKVTAVALEASQATVTTTGATLEDAIEEAEVIVSQALTVENITSFVPLVKGVSLQEGVPGPVKTQACFTFNNVFFDADGNEGTTNDQIGLNGSACLNPTFDFALGVGISWKWGIPRPTLKNLTFAVGVSESIDLQLYANYVYAVGTRIPIATTTFGAVTFGPVVVVPVLTVYVGIDGSLSAGVTAGLSQSADLRLGIAYSGGNWSPIADFSNNFSFSLPSVQVGAQVRAYAQPELAFLLYGVGGPYVNMAGYFDLEMNPLINPWLALYGGIQAGAGVKVEVFGKDLVDFEFPSLFDYRLLLAQVTNNSPTITSLTANPTRIFTGQTSVVTATVSDPDNDPLTCTWSTNGGSLSSTTGCGSVTWTAPATPGTYNVSISATDNKPGHNPVSEVGFDNGRDQSATGH